MRYWFLALMIVLLPARGWVGHAMAMDMAAQQVIMAQSAVSAELDAMPEDCPMFAQAAAEATDPHCNSCDTCELCLALASFSWSDVPAQVFAPQAGPLDHGSRFSSADSGPGIKPPIS